MAGDTPVGSGTQMWRWTLWIGQVLLATFFLEAAYLHAAVPIQAAAEQAPWIADVPVALARFIGLAEPPQSVLP